MHQLFKAVLPTEEILAELRGILESGWIGLGPKTAEFERGLSAFIGPRTHFLALNSCTSALHLAFKVLDLPKGSRVLTTPLTFVSTNHAILYEGLTPVFCDVDPLTGNLDPESVETALANHPIAAILVVHLGGYPCDMDRINAMAGPIGIPVIEDCAHAFGGRYPDGRRIGDTDNLCAWSFQAVKNLPVGDGGAISTTNTMVRDRLKKLRWLGIDQDTISRFQAAGTEKVYQYKWDYNVGEVGYKYHLNDIASAIGVVQLRHVEEANRRRAAIASIYRGRLGDAPGVSLPAYASVDYSSYHFFPLFFERKAEVYRALVEKEIFPGMHYKRNDRYPMYAECLKVGRKDDTLHGVEWFEARELTLPIHLGLTDDDIHAICDVVLSACGQGLSDWGKGGSLPAPARAPASSLEKTARS
ncbi:MAG: DegT/DnrJ/EryC1/StrS family aminotransferase [Fibrobacterota bacterium]|nr:DegT/DnrJ/EryC1/StrS family aminotransferase [Fibrobacterota bacterium]